MPSIGEVSTSREIGRTGHSSYVWQACPHCGKERWIDKYYLIKNPSLMCRSCMMKFCSNRWFGNPQKGSDNPRWRGGRKDTEGYNAIRMFPGDDFYPQRSQDGYILEHRLVMMRHLGRPLLSSEIVHHLDGNRYNNKLENLQLTTRGTHELSYRHGYKKGFADGLAFARLNENKVSVTG
jgi:hypothetical protein